MMQFTAGEKNVTVYPCEKTNAPVIYLNTIAPHGEEILKTALSLGAQPFSLVEITGLCWERDMVPWNCDAVFRNAPPFIGGGDAYIQFLTRQIIPAAEKTLPAPPSWRGIAGYSLAGLFAIYTVYQTELFSKVASMSGSLWFPGMKEYIFTHFPKCSLKEIYFSLGDKESKTRNPYLKTVQEDTEEIFQFYKKQGIPAVFRLNPGNHVYQAMERTAAGIAWLLKENGNKTDSSTAS
jgi:predicted alpha/beta superfamily hydrolase